MKKAQLDKRSIFQRLDLCQLKAALLSQNNITGGKNYTACLPFLTVILQADWPENTAEQWALLSSI